ncbi:MAG: MobA/MobL family protein [Lachnospiraceae bacterium]|nr:MobA/MobL family protein [Lachnospiraceae bacterium]
MSIYHCSIKIISRSSGRSAVSAAAYRSGEKLFCEETGLTHDYTHKGGVVMNEILLPKNAPSAYLDRSVLWNSVQSVEKRTDAQLCREVEVAFPVEMSRDEMIACVRSYIRENFTSKGMIADWALHDKGDGNPHAHILLTLRSFDTNGQWMQKQKTVFANARDEKGHAIYDPTLPGYDPQNKEATARYRIPALDANGDQKVRIRDGKGKEYLWEKVSIPANDWNDHANAEIWRESWAKHCNRYLSPENRIDHRSYERQGIELEPTIHEGVSAREMEIKGSVSDRCMINRNIRERNHLREILMQKTKELAETIRRKAGEIYERLRNINSDREQDILSGRTDLDHRIATAANREAERGIENDPRMQALMVRRMAFERGGYDGDAAGRDAAREPESEIRPAEIRSDIEPNIEH